MKREPLFRVEGLRFAYEGPGSQGPPVLDLPALELAAAGVTVLVGANGSGKTTLLKLLNALLVPREGRILYRGRALGPQALGPRPADPQTLSALRRETVLVHQDPYLFDGSVYANVSYGLRLRRTPAAAARRGVAGALAAVGLSGFEHRRARALSGGERQRVAMARALALEPEVLLLDEPTANVDAASTLLIEALIRRQAAAGRSVVLSSHHQGLAYRLADRLVYLEEGRVVPGRENVLKGRVEAGDELFTLFRTGDGALRCPAREGSFTTAVLPLDDVILSTEETHTSAQNRFVGTVTAVSAPDPDDHTVRVRLDCGFPLEALVTAYSRDSLGIATGARFHVTFKASAVRLY